MEHIKDINKRHINGQDSRHLFLAKKTEKIVSAIFMVTDLFGNDINRIKKTLQEESVDVLDLVHQLHNPIKFEHTLLITLERKYTYIVSLLEVALQVNVLSESNATILIKELYGCIDRIHSIKASPLSELQKETLSHESFQIPAIMDGFEPTPPSTNLFKESIQDKIQSSNQRDIREEQPKTYKTPKPQPRNTNQTSTPAPQTRADSGDKSQAKKDRQKNIIDFLKGKGNVSITDIYAQFDGITSKTIQRDLNELIKDNVVEREGNKRWATYKAR